MQRRRRRRKRKKGNLRAKVDEHRVMLLFDDLVRTDFPPQR